MRRAQNLDTGEHLDDPCTLMSAIDESWDLAAKGTKLIAPYNAMPREIGYAVGAWTLEYIGWPLNRRLNRR